MYMRTRPMAQRADVMGTGPCTQYRYRSSYLSLSGVLCVQTEIQECLVGAADQNSDVFV